MLTRDTTLLNFHKPEKKLWNKIWTKQSKRPTISKHVKTAKKVLYAIFFHSDDVVAQIPFKKA